MKIEAEGEELIIRNRSGQIAIIPTKYRQEALEALRLKNHGFLNDLVSSLPSVEQYARQGTKVPLQAPIDLLGLSRPTFSQRLENQRTRKGILTTDQVLSLLNG